jgi:CTP:molybdopterin cytidylyltransferase MocA
MMRIRRTSGSYQAAGGPGRVVQWRVRVVAVVLAAGEGRRMGGPKALARLRGRTFLEHCVDVLRRPGVERVVAVLGHQAERIRAEVPLDPDTLLVDNAAWAAGMLSSVRRGVDAAEELGAGALLLHPVDHPLVEADTVDAVLAALAAGAVVAVPSYAGRRGHPAGFARAAWDALQHAPEERGARAVLADHPEWVRHVPGGPGSRRGLDTPADLEGAETGN